MGKQMVNRAIVVLAAGMIVASTAAEGPQMVSYQGRLVGGGTDPVNLEFRFYDAEAGGNLLWSETHPSVQRENGLFTVYIGSATTGAIPDEALDYKRLDPNALGLWLAVAVNGEAELPPRQRIVTVPFAAKAEAAEGLAKPGTFELAASVDASGSVGIGTTSPEAQLHVLRTQPDNQNLLELSFEGGNVGGLGETFALFRVTTTSNYRPLMSLDGKVLVTAGGKIGIGTTSPEAPLDIASTSGVPSIVTRGGNDYGVADDEYIDFGHWDGSYFTRRMRISPNGNVGLGTSMPEARLHVGGEAGVDGIMFPDGTLQTTAATGSQWSDTTGGICYDGNVGIRTCSPTTELHTRGGFTISRYGSTGFPFDLVPDSESLHVFVTDSAACFISEQDENTGGSGGMSFFVDDDDSASPSFHFQTKSGTSLLYVKANGRVGIGTSSPQETLHVEGTTRTDVIHITGADLAEKFPVSERVEPGMVVAIDPVQAGQLRLAREPYSKLVAGVVSGANGLHAGAVLGHLPGNEDAPPIAMTGRVWCWCDADAGGPIRPGDLLTTSNTPGHAMRADEARDFPRGCIIGKAMSNVESGRGMVLILVQPQ